MDIAAAAHSRPLLAKANSSLFMSFMRTNLLVVLCAKTGIQALLGLQFKDGCEFYACLDIPDFFFI